ncbi:hypothetical protein AVEN_230103-1 [Araneus ventricosus]|uniref:Uncharacterized protein n=1 Tax=Araneus ventricosus TaxID=182803 RepID=A0A4Y2V0K4_ARAVE|nr:hypothetical protein AVEN_230103-1 [Araneus ventricosus]
MQNTLKTDLVSCKHLQLYNFNPLTPRSCLGRSKIFPLGEGRSQAVWIPFGVRFLRSTGDKARWSNYHLQTTAPFRDHRGRVIAGGGVKQYTLVGRRVQFAII